MMYASSHNLHKFLGYALYALLCLALLSLFAGTAMADPRYSGAEGGRHQFGPDGQGMGTSGGQRGLGLDAYGNPIRAEEPEKRKMPIERTLPKREKTRPLPDVKDEGQVWGF